MLFNLLQTDTLVEAASEAVEQMTATPAAQPAEMNESLFSLFTMGGPLMWVLLALSILAIYLIGRKWWIIKQASKIDHNFMNDIRDYMNQGKTKSALTLCSKYDNPVARMTETGIRRLGRPGTGGGNYVVDAYPVLLKIKDVLLIFATILVVGCTSALLTVRHAMRKADNQKSRLNDR